MRAPDQILPYANLLGEGPVWDSARGRLLWTDIQARRLYSLDPATGATRSMETPERLGALALINSAPDRVLAAFETGFGVFDLEHGAVHWLHQPEIGRTGRRFNDGRVDRQGRFWAGTMVEEEALAGQNTAQLWRVGLDGRVSAHRSGIGISNGICFSPDGRILYFADSPRQIILAFDLDIETGDISGERLFAEVAQGYPDGATVDAEGCVWSACWGAGRVVRYAPDGRAIGALAVPASQPTSIAFGGPDLTTAFVTSARDELDATALAGQPHAGDLFVFDLDIQGLPEPQCRDIF